MDEAATTAITAPADTVTGMPPVDTTDIAGTVTAYSDYALEMAVEHGPRAIGALLLLFIGWLLAKWIGRIVREACVRTKLEITLAKFFGKMATWAVLIGVILACLSIFEVNTTSFAAVLAALGLAIGLALQGTLSNFAAGVMLLIFRPFKVGDVVTVATETGVIDEIELFSTTMDTPDNRRLTLPNGSIFGATIENKTFHKYRRVDVPVGVTYSADLDQTREVLLSAAMSVEGQDPDTPPMIFLCGLGSSSVDWQVRVWCLSTEYFPKLDETTRATKIALDEAGLSIPFPQMDVHADGVLVTKAE